MLSVTVVLFRPKADEFRKTVDSLLANAEDVKSVHILVSGTRNEFSAIEALTSGLRGVTECYLYHRFDNLGFASGHNFLLEQAFALGSDAALVLNPDVIMQPGSLQGLAVAMKAQPNATLLGPTLSRATNNGNARKTFDSAGIEWTSTARHFDKLQGEAWNIHSGRQDAVSGVTGACLVVDKNSFDQIRNESGYFFDDLFLAYREDAELGIRAGELGIPSVVVHMDGFAHVRSVRGYERGNSLADLLGVRNRFLLRWSLGRLRPGNAAVSWARDGLVILAVALVERSSLPGLEGARAIRRYARNRGRNWRRNATAKDNWWVTARGGRKKN